MLLRAMMRCWMLLCSAHKLLILLSAFIHVIEAMIMSFEVVFLYRELQHRFEYHGGTWMSE